MNNKLLKRLEELEKDQRQAAIPSGLGYFYETIKETEQLFYPECTD